jgi:phosphatidate phosphatase APP1
MLTDIYMEIVANYPNRIKPIYIKSVPNKKRIHQIKNLIKNYADTPFL